MFQEMESILEFLKQNASCIHLFLIAFRGNVKLFAFWYKINELNHVKLLILCHFGSSSDVV